LKALQAVVGSQQQLEFYHTLTWTLWKLLSLNLPQSEYNLLCHIEEGASPNNCADSVPEISCIHVPINLELGVVQNLPQEHRGLSAVREIDPRCI